MFPRDSSGRSIIFPVKEESQRVATSCPFSMRANSKEPSRLGLMLPPTRYPLMKTPGPVPSSRTLIHVHQAASLPVAQVEDPTLRDGPVVTPWPPV